jgi:hypothetical protein
MKNEGKSIKLVKGKGLQSLLKGATKGKGKGEIKNG